METSKKIHYQTQQTYWLSRSNQSLYNYCLKQLAQLTTTIFKGENTVNPNQNLLDDIQTKLTESQFELYQILVHSLTLLNSNYRIFTQNGYEVSKEDMINVLSLFQLQVNPESALSHRSKWIYNQLFYRFPNQEFTVTQACNLLAIKKPTMKIHIVSLRNTGHIKHTKTGINNTFYYKVNK